MKKYFVKQGIREVSIEDFIRENFPSADYSNIELQRTPLGIKVLIYTHNPGRVIGRSGSKINRMSETLKTKFDLANPQLDVKTIENPNLDAKIVAKQIKTALEKGYNYKKIGNLAMKRVMDAGAVGVEIVISGKLGGSKGRTGKFIDGYLKHCGDTSDKLVDKGFEEANTKPGKIGIKVKIMNEFMDITGKVQKKIKEKEKPIEEEVVEKAKETGEHDELGEEVGTLDFEFQEEASEPAPEAETKPKSLPADKGEGKEKKDDAAGETNKREKSNK